MKKCLEDDVINATFQRDF